MIHSCFDDRSGLYDYYQSSEQLAINADLPTPRLPMATGGIGVPAIEAGRPLPAGARHVGRGWQAKGTIVECGRGPKAGMGALPAAVSSVVDGFTSGGWKWFAGGLVAYWLVRRIS